MRVILTVCLWMLTALSTAAQDVATADRLTAAFKGWMDLSGAEQGAISIRYKGDLIAQAGFGMDAETPMEMASLSKAITGVCIAELVREKKLSYEDRFVDLIGKGPDVTMAELLNQSSGLFPDRTQSIMWMWARTGHDNPAAGVLDIVSNANAPLQNRGRFQYNNENYALLGLVIENVSGQRYREACTARVLEPAGVILALTSPISDGFLPWGGWYMSVSDYGAFLSHWYANDSVMGRDPHSQPNATVTWGVHYGQGMFFRSARNGHNFWHHGALCFSLGQNAGSFAVSWAGDWSVVAAYKICPSRKNMSTLDTALSGAVFQ